ncbi:MAG: Spy/CpxP family protein refolding chaperone [Campylobacteraceae bacterium]|jgi:Spy/CpxP family protein refolding chaperone|nr:Spy/CpxP family protein refolding chaperone [Campylobacteraceae bacterium]
MRKSLLVLTAVSILTLSGAIAANISGGNQQVAEHNHKQAGVKGRGDKVRDNNDTINHHGRHHTHMSFLYKLNLSLEQKQQVDVYKNEASVQAKSIFNNENKTKNYFSENYFNKEAFLKDKKETSSARAEIRANYIEKVYSILSDEQKKQIPDLFAKKTEEIQKNSKK